MQRIDYYSFFNKSDNMIHVFDIYKESLEQCSKL